MSENKSFEETILSWLIDEAGVINAKEVANFEAEGSDWEGGTEEGFYTQTGIRIHYLDDDGNKKVYYPSGDQYEGLWLYVMNKWPKGAA